MEAIYFLSPEEFRAWLEEHHETETEVLVGFYKKNSGKRSMTWSESVDEALSFGWIDGRGKRVDDERFTIRFTPRRPRSVWSDRNIKRVEDLTAQGRMRPAGIRAFESRSEERSRVYSFEQDVVEFSDGYEQTFQRNAKAWEFFQSQAPWYRKAATHWVVSAKREATRERRLAQLIEDSGNGRRIRQLDRSASSRSSTG